MGQHCNSRTVESVSQRHPIIGNTPPKKLARGTLLTLTQPTPQNGNELAPIVDKFRVPPKGEECTDPEGEERTDSEGEELTDPEIEERTDPFKVGIIGAGVAGLFTAMIFDYLNEEYHTNVEYEIMECNDKSRLGGRLYTHYFTEAKHDYFDVGAMRFPDIGTMKQYVLPKVRPSILM